MSGLGVDHRAFSKIHFNGFQITYLKWITSFPNEKMSEYAKRLSTNIKSQKPILIGLSFGRMVAMEIAKLINTEKIILIASAKDEHELPAAYQFLGKLNLNKLIPNSFLKQHNMLVDYFFGINMKEDSLMLKQILQETDSTFLAWAIHQILNWKNKSWTMEIIHIHGKKDRIIPIKNITPTYIIDNAGHFMTITHANEINKILKIILKD